MIIVSETSHVHVFKANSDLDKNMNNSSKKNSTNIELYLVAGPVSEAPIALLPTGVLSEDDGEVMITLVG